MLRNAMTIVSGKGFAFLQGSSLISQAGPNNFFGPA
jgi:hypothetical protein